MEMNLPGAEQVTATPVEKGLMAPKVQSWMIHHTFFGYQGLPLRNCVFLLETFLKAQCVSFLHVVTQKSNRRIFVRWQRHLHSIGACPEVF